MQILHVLSDYPDPIHSATAASKNLMALAPTHEHKVYSFVRADWRPGLAATSFDDSVGEGHRAIAYGAPPKGLFLARHLDRLADWIRNDAERRALRPDVVHAHKLSMDALVGERLAAHFGVPLLVSSQGNSDCRIIGVKRDLHARWRRIWRDAAVIFPFAPWTTERLSALLGARDGPIRVLPCPTPQDALQPPRPGGALIRSAFNLTGWRMKNAARLIQAAAAAARQAPELRLEIIGGGDARAFLELSRIAERAGGGVARLTGAAPHDRIPALFHEAGAFAMPSLKESYGMVFAEALLAGTPILYSRGRGFDGYFEDGAIGVGVDPEDVGDITNGLVRLARDEAAFKDRLAHMQQSGGLDLLRRDAIAATYLDALTSCADAPGSKQ